MKTLSLARAAGLTLVSRGRTTNSMSSAAGINRRCSTVKGSWLTRILDKRLLSVFSMGDLYRESG